MKVIISNLKILSNFNKISKINLLSLLPYTYSLYKESFDYEKKSLDINYVNNFMKIEKLDITTEEFFLASDLKNKYKKITIHDSLALSIAKSRNLQLLTDDNHSKAAAVNEKIEVISTTDLLNYLIRNELITEFDYNYCLQKLNVSKRLMITKESLNENKVYQI